MDLVRLDTTCSGIIYMRASALFSLGGVKSEDGTKQTNVRFVAEGGGVTNVFVAGDVDEVAAMFESIRGWDIYRLV